MESNFWKDGFAKNLKKLRKQRGLTLDSLADNINKKYNTNFNKSMLSKWENGAEATVSSLIYLSMFFDVTLDYILALNNNEEEFKEKHNHNHSIPIFEFYLSDKEQLLRTNKIGYAMQPPLIQIHENELKNFFYLKLKAKKQGLSENNLILINKSSVDNPINKVLLFHYGHEIIPVQIKNSNDFLRLIKLIHNNTPTIFDIEKIRLQIIGTAVGAFTLY